MALVLAGPNGSGKSTVAPILVPQNVPFLNADDVAKDLPGYPSRSVDALAGRQILEAMDDFESRHESFATETTLAGRSPARRVVRLRSVGYDFLLFFLWSPSVELSIRRVGYRVRLGGHSVPIETFRRRFEAGRTNLFRYDLPIADDWSVDDNTDATGPIKIASGGVGETVLVNDDRAWSELSKEFWP